MMQERNIVNTIISVSSAGYIEWFFNGIREFYAPLMPYFYLAITLIILDCRFGIRKAKHNKEKVKGSRAVRRTGNKIIDYFGWVTVATLFGNSFAHVLGIPYLALFVLLLIYGNELSSCIVNYFESKGLKIKLNLWAFFKKDSKILEVEEIPEKDSCLQNKNDLS